MIKIQGLYINSPSNSKSHSLPTSYASCVTVPKPQLKEIDRLLQGDHVLWVLGFEYVWKTQQLAITSRQRRLRFNYKKYCVQQRTYMLTLQGTSVLEPQPRQTAVPLIRFLETSFDMRCRIEAICVRWIGSEQLKLCRIHSNIRSVGHNNIAQRYVHVRSPLLTDVITMTPYSQMAFDGE